VSRKFLHAVRKFITKILFIGPNKKRDPGNFREKISGPDVSDDFDGDGYSIHCQSAIMKETKRISHREK
jgi:hypothetical protein